MNKLILLLAGAALSISSAQAGIGDLFKQVKDTALKAKDLATQAKTLTESAKVYKPGAAKGDKQFTPVSIEIKNKGNDIWVAIKTDESFYTQDNKEITKVAAGKTQPFEAPIDKPYEIFVWTSEPASTETTPTKLYKLNADETGYLTADPGGILRPQTGPAKGKLDKTDTGLSTLRNARTVTALAITVKAPPAPVAKPAPAAQPAPKKAATPPAPVARPVPAVPPAKPIAAAQPAQKTSIPVPPPMPSKQPAVKPPAPKIVVEEETPAPQEGRSDLLASIRAGKTLRPVGEQNVAQKKPQGSSVAASLAQSAAFKKVARANRPEEETSAA